jgi:hypothetical protein
MARIVNPGASLCDPDSGARDHAARVFTQKQHRILDDRVRQE